MDKKWVAAKGEAMIRGEGGPTPSPVGLAHSIGRHLNLRRHPVPTSRLYQLLDFCQW